MSCPRRSPPALAGAGAAAAACRPAGVVGLHGLALQEQGAPADGVFAHCRAVGRRRRGANTRRPHDTASASAAGTRYHSDRGPLSRSPSGSFCRGALERSAGRGAAGSRGPGVSRRRSRVQMFTRISRRSAPATGSRWMWLIFRRSTSRKGARATRLLRRSTCTWWQGSAPRASGACSGSSRRISASRLRTTD